MATVATQSSSRVIVECTDPSNLFDHFTSRLSKYLPLRNLHWKSPKRPLRSIDELNVSITKSERQTERTASPRRHQIPGLRPTPFVKIFLLRCDDNDTYKESSRKQIRQWIKSISSAKEVKAPHAPQELHDAFEWLVVHLIVPDTPAATQPRFSKPGSLAASDSTDSVASKSKWPSKTSGTLFEKIRADFESSSKKAIERVAQIRLSNEGNESKLSIPDSEDRDQWEDLTEKLKAAILKSFHSRVSQYEDDIKERDLQRNLPGWNFCTFFILKEGLAQGFENVGLLDDASTVYDELALGLDVVIRDEIMRRDGDQDPSLLPFSKHLKDKIRRALDALHDNEVDSGVHFVSEDFTGVFDSNREKLPFSNGTSSYRDMILANEVSALDFRIYLFSRQLEIMQKQASKRRYLQNEKGNGLSSIADLSMAADICQKGAHFISLAARCMRNELYGAWGGQQGLNEEDLLLQDIIIGNIVSSWVWLAISQLLSSTDIPALRVFGDHTTIIKEPFNVKNHPPVERTPSVGTHVQNDLRQSIELDHSDPLEENLGHNAVEHLRRLSSFHQAPAVVDSRNGFERLALWRAELLLQARGVVQRLIELLAGQSVDEQESTVGEVLQKQKLPTIGSIPNSSKTSADGITFSIGAGLEPDVLRKTVHFHDRPVRLFEDVTKLAWSHFAVANRTNSARKALYDLGISCLGRQDYVTAAAYFEQLIEFQDEVRYSPWSQLLLYKFSKCLKELGRDKEYVRCVLRLLSCQSEHDGTLDEAKLTSKEIQTYIHDVQTISKSLTDSIRVNFSSMFYAQCLEELHMESHPGPGYSISLLMATRIPVQVTIDQQMKLSLAGYDTTFPSELELIASLPVTIGPDPVKVIFRSYVETLGWYRIGVLEISIGKLSFVHDFADSEIFPNNIATRAFLKPVLVYPSSNAPRVGITQALHLNLAESRELLVKIRTGEAALENVNLQLKSSTAGLRLHSHGASKFPSDHDFLLESGSTTRISEIRKSSEISFNLPYTLESADISELTIRLVISYLSQGQTYTFHATKNINIILQLSVNVHDVYKDDALFSRFTIAPATLVPLRLESCSIQAAQLFPDHNPVITRDIDIFPKQPVSWLCRFVAGSESPSPLANSAPVLIVSFRSLDEMILSALELQFLGDIAKADIRELSQALCSHLLDVYRSKWTEKDLESACLLGLFKVWPYDAMGWQSILSGLSNKMRREASSWLQQWHKEHILIELNHRQSQLRSISIPVELPVPKACITVAFSLQGATRGASTISLGQPASFQLCILYNNHWQMQNMRQIHERLEISFEMFASTEDWLIGGSRKGCACLEPGGDKRIPLLLVPQRIGKLLLPSIQIRCFSVPHLENDFPFESREEVAYELNYVGQAKSITVTSDLQCTALAVMREEAEGSRSALIGTSPYGS